MTIVEGGQLVGLGIAAAGLFLLLPVSWFLLVVGLVVVVLLTLVEHSRRPEPGAMDRMVDTERVEPETDGA